MKKRLKTKKNPAKIIAIGMLSAAFAMATFTGCEVHFSYGTYSPKIKEMVLGTDPYQSYSNVVSPYSVSEGFNSYGRPFTSYSYKGSDIKPDLKYTFNNSSARNVELLIDGYTRDVDFDIKNARLSANYIGGKSTVKVEVSTDVNDIPKAPYNNDIPVFEVNGYEEITVVANAGTKVRLGSTYHLVQ